MLQNNDVFIHKTDVNTFPWSLPLNRILYVHDPIQFQYKIHWIWTNYKTYAPYVKTIVVHLPCPSAPILWLELNDFFSVVSSDTPIDACA